MRFKNQHFKIKCCATLKWKIIFSQIRFHQIYQILIVNRELNYYQTLRYLCWQTIFNKFKLITFHDVGICKKQNCNIGIRFRLKQNQKQITFLCLLKFFVFLQNSLLFVHSSINTTCIVWLIIALANLLSPVTPAICKGSMILKNKRRLVIH